MNEGYAMQIAWEIMYKITWRTHDPHQIKPVLPKIDM
jgi:hypothetical protein